MRDADAGRVECGRCDRESDYVSHNDGGRMPDAMRVDVLGRGGVGPGERGRQAQGELRSRD
jgi:hypothetical protein